MTPPKTVTQALTELRDVMLSVVIPGGRLWRIALIAVAPLILDGLVLLVGEGGTPWPELGWVALYGVFAAYLMLASRYISERLIGLGPRIDQLLDSDKSRAEVVGWIERVTPFWPQVIGCLLVAAGAATLVGVVVDDNTSNPPVRLSWLVAVAIAMFFACDAISWVVRYSRLVAQIGKKPVLAVQTAAPVQTPAVRELRDFSATLAAITGVGLFFFSVPLLWLLIYVKGHNEHIEVVLRNWSLAAFAVCAVLSLYAAVAPQMSLALLVGTQRDRILDAIDLTIPKGDPSPLYCEEVAERRKLFDAIAATRTSTVGVTSAAKWALGLLAPALPFVLSWLTSAIGL